MEDRVGSPGNYSYFLNGNSEHLAYLRTRIGGTGHQQIGLPQGEANLDLPEHPRADTRNHQSRHLLDIRVVDRDDPARYVEDGKVAVDRRREEDIECGARSGQGHLEDVGGGAPAVGTDRI